ncbi:hypothetical protein I6F35_31615 [Bradyrhizobium sp. BRP22]|uniref:hypothetical protein n=1 Tax=Bradyrhizobium sp. BRP22 TaxID=2793821 RepID=UPI001CD483FA|nr:hypothetical protein [Bradyrhizobium sp. BRP22]MCA1457688.1 hypothetical protein [Bradyrhizobium sp. BRP22]
MDHIYRIFIFGDDGHIIDRVDLDCEDETTAKQRAKELVNGRPVELWDGTRKIERFEPKD